MNRKKLIIGLIFTSFLSLSSLKANLQSELVNLNNALINLEMKLQVAPQPLPRDVTTCPVPQPTTIQQRQVQPTQQARLQRPKSAYVTRPQEEQAQDISLGIAKGTAKQVQPLAQTAPSGRIPVVQPKQGQRLARTTSGYIPAKKKRDDEKPTLIALPINIPLFEGSSIKLQGFARRANDLLTAQNPKNDAKQIYDEINKKVATWELKIENESSRQLLYAITKGILSIDPLLIQTSLETLRVAGIPKDALYKLMIFLYQKRIDFLTYEFSLMNKKDYKLTEGIRNDIDEALTYPIEISGELQDAEIKAGKLNSLAKEALAKEAANEPLSKEEKDLLIELRKVSNFYNTANNEWERLLLLLKDVSAKQKQALLEKGIDIDQYISNIEENKLRAYCRFDPKLKKNECKPYLSFYEELSTMAKNADDFKNNKLKYNRSTKTFAIQNIINKLNAFAIYAKDPTICQICLNEDAQKANEETTEQDFNNIKSLFDDLVLTEPNNNTYLEALKIIDSIKADEAVRRSKIRKLGIGFQYD